MMRMIGLVAGVGIGLLIILLVLDTGRNEQAAVTGAEGITTAAELSGVVTAIAEQVDRLPAGATHPAGAIAAATESVTAEKEPQPAVERDTPEPTHQPPAQFVTETEDIEQEDSEVADSYLFWSPFRSEWAAQGFAARLSSATQVAVEVVNTGPGRYRVAFDYQDEAERRARIERIESITGLELE